ncbi:hypothetical protein GGR56DRAFT_82277 [Xylariaceae sp. FL0804]|nr:hypothetical protein GGR56DRAFT_82277 [Xylariaceae sp. FL0804]
MRISHGEWLACWLWPAMGAADYKVLRTTAPNMAATGGRSFAPETTTATSAVVGSNSHAQPTSSSCATQVASSQEALYTHAPAFPPIRKCAPAILGLARSRDDRNRVNPSVGSALSRRALVDKHAQPQDLSACAAGHLDRDSDTGGESRILSYISHLARRISAQ